MKVQLVIAMALALLITVVGRADEGPTAAKATETRKEQMNKKAQAGKSAFEMGRNFTVITFNPGSNELTVAEKANLRAFVDQAKATGTVERVRVIAWADKPLPTGRGVSDLPKSDRDLANSRIEKIEEFLETDLGIANVKSFSMAERANWFARVINTTEAELKSIFARKSAEHEVNQEQLRVIKEQGGPTKAIILVQDKDTESLSRSPERASENRDSDTTSGSSESVPPTAEEPAN